MKLFILIFLTLFIFACNKQTGIIIPTGEQILVVNSNLCADSIILINLSYSQSISNNLPETKITNANVMLYNQDTVYLETLNHQGNGNYFSTGIAKVANKYIIQINYLNKIYWTSDSVPQQPIGAINSTDSIVFRNKPNFLQIHYSLSDKQKYQNFYGIKMKHIYEAFLLTGTSIKEEWVDIETIDPILIEDINSKFSKQQLLFTDKYFNNATINLTFGTSKIVNNSAYQTKQLIIYCEQYTEKAFNYFSSVNEHIFYQNDPFSQPVTVKGNVSNAYGAFIGKNTIADTIKFKY